jgi:V/A-type H+-transporting ATPase subunit D
MDAAQTATKGNLMNARNSLKMAAKGYELLDRKRKLLMREMASLMDRAKALQGRISETFREAYDALRQANVTLGIDNVEFLAEAIPEEQGVDIKFYSVMGVEIPIVRDLTEEKNVDPGMSLYQTNIYFDKAVYSFCQVKKLVYELAEVENGIYRLASNIRKTQKRANALKNIMIPRYTALVADISAALEEKEREEFSRLKVIKKMVK